MEWKTIDSAPKDRPILVYCTASGGELYGVYDEIEPFYDVVDGGPVSPGYEPKTKDHNGPTGNWWHSTSEYYALFVWPTHWQELPKPPSEVE